MLLQLQLALLLSVHPQLLLLFPLPKMGNPQELSATSIISAALSLLRPGLLGTVLKQTLQVTRLTPRAGQVAETLLILWFKLWVQSPPLVQHFIYACPGLAARDRLSSSSSNGAAASQVQQAASLSLAVSAYAAHSFSDSASVSVCTHPSFSSFSSSSVPPLIYVPSVTPHSPVHLLVYRSTNQ